MFTSRRTSSTTRRRSVRLSSIAEDSRLRPPVGVRTVLSSIGGGQPLSSPKRHSLGRPLPYQLADITQAAPEANCFFTLRLASQGPSGIAPSFDGICPTSGYVPTCYYLVCHGHITRSAMMQLTENSLQFTEGEFLILLFTVYCQLYTAASHSM